MTGCGTSPELAVTPSAPASPTETNPTPEPSVEPTAQLADCSSVLDEAGNADLAADNLKPSEFQFQNWDYPLLAEIAESGVVCKWAGGGDVYVVVGQLAMDEAAWAATRSELEAAGYAQDDSYGIDGFIDGPDGDDESYPTRGFAWCNGILYYASYPGILEFVPAFQA
jgi:hypothetical protein